MIGATIWAPTVRTSDRQLHGGRCAGIRQLIFSLLSAVSILVPLLALVALRTPSTHRTQETHS
jgi:hypothetical protein